MKRSWLTYALKTGETSKVIKNDKDVIDYGDTYPEIYPTTPWNYGLIEMPENKLTENYYLKKLAGSVVSLEPGKCAACH